jgi:lipoprotein-releasing system permease protein
MKYELFIAKRYLKPKRSQLFVSLTTMLTMLGVMIGVAALIVVLSGMNGFAGEIVKQLIGMNAHMWVRSHSGMIEDSPDIIDDIRSNPNVIGASPVIYQETLLASRYDQTGAQIKAVDSTTIGDVSNIISLMETDTVNSVGYFDIGRREWRDNKPGMLLGWQLANKLRVGIGEQVFVMVPPKNASGAVWMVQPRLVAFQVTGIFKSGFFEFDAALAIIDLAEAQAVFETGPLVTAIEVKLDDAFNAGVVAGQIREKLGGYPYYAWTWVEQNGGLYKWLMIEKWFAFVILSLIIVVAAFNIVSTLSMVVLDKTREIGILMAMGATAREISRIFLYQGFVVGVVGTLSGGALGYFLCWLQDTYRIVRLPAELYQVSAFPVEMRLFDFVAIGSAALLICLLSAIYPAWKAARMNPVEAIHHD